MLLLATCAPPDLQLKLSTKLVGLLGSRSLNQGFSEVVGPAPWQGAKRHNTCLRRKKGSHCSATGTRWPRQLFLHLSLPNLPQHLPQPRLPQAPSIALGTAGMGHPQHSGQYQRTTRRRPLAFSQLLARPPFCTTWVEDPLDSPRILSSPAYNKGSQRQTTPCAQSHPTLP